MFVGCGAGGGWGRGMASEGVCRDSNIENVRAKVCTAKCTYEIN